MEFGEKLGLLLKERKLSQRKFAEEIQINYVNLNQYVKGSRTAPIEVVEKVIEYFPEIDLNWLLRKEAPGKMLNEANMKYEVPVTPATIIENIEKNLKELKGQLSQK